VQDVAAIGRLCRERGVLLHVDGVQAVGHLPLELDAVPFDFYTFSAHKFGGPRGTGGVFTRDAEPVPQISGGGQERGLRAGTENVAGLAGALEALRLCTGMMAGETARLRRLARLLVDELGREAAEFVLNSDLEEGLPGLVSLSFPGVSGTTLVADLDLMGFAVSAGSACHSNRVEPSRVIAAMGRPEELALGTVRVSMGRFTEEDGVRRLARTLAEAVGRQKRSS
jgi:cysteine desulfurase